MRSRRTAHDEMAAIARRRLEMLSVELAGIRSSLPGEPDAVAGTEPAPAEQPAAGTGAASGIRSTTLEETAPEEASLADGLGADGLGADGLRMEALQGWGAGPARGRHARRPVGRADRLGGWVHDRLPPTLQGRVRLEAGHLSVVAVLVAAALGVTAWWVVRADGGATVVPAAVSSQTGEGLEASASGQLVTPAADPSTTAAVETEPAVLVVDVAGKVRRPGIATLPVGSRVVDALEAAGGARRGVDLSALNLARLLVDGEQIVVGVPPPGGVAAPAASGPSAPGGSAGPMVNINSATQAQLEELPGVGPVTAEAILQWRTDHGPFTAVDELLEVSGIGDATLAEIAPFVTL